jgi:hypothetical protein
VSYRKYDVWSRELPDGRVVEYVYGTLFQPEGRTKSWAGAKVAGVPLSPIQNLASDMTRPQVEALFDHDIAGQ